jgi:hypothetical protein
MEWDRVEAAFWVVAQDMSWTGCWHKATRRTFQSETYTSVDSLRHMSGRDLRVRDVRHCLQTYGFCARLKIPCVPLATEPGWLADRCSVSQQLGALQTHTTDTYLFISETTNVPLFKFRCNIFIGVRIIKEMPGSVASGTPGIIYHVLSAKRYPNFATGDVFVRI